MPEEVTIEGYAGERVLIDGETSGHYIVTVDDGTGSLRVLVEPDTPGRYWGAWPGRRIQVDLLTGAKARRQVEDVINADPERRRLTPGGECALARVVRMGVQIAR